MIKKILKFSYRGDYSIEKLCNIAKQNMKEIINFKQK